MSRAEARSMMELAGMPVPSANTCMRLSFICSTLSV